MDVCGKLKRVAVRCVPNAARIWRSKKKHRAVIRDGVWLGRQIKKEHLSDGEPYVRKTNLRKWKVLPLDTAARERVMDGLLKQYGFTFETMLVLCNPYGRTPLSAILIFETKEPYYVAYTVKGKMRECDFSYETKKRSRIHHIPVLGLYADTNNRVEVRLLNERRETISRRRLVIPIPPIPDNITELVEPVLQTEQTAMPFILITGGIGGSTYACDQNGDIRYYLSRKPKQYGIYPLSDGRFLFPERKINQPTYINPHANVIHDMDLLGRVRETYYIPGGTHHCMTQVPGTDGRLVLAAASSMKNRMEDMVICYDREDGRILRKYDLGQLFPQEFRNRCDWAHLNSICCDGEGAMLVSLRNLHTVAKIDLQSGTLVWLLAHPQQYKGTVLEDSVLEPVGEAFHYFFQQHAAQIVHTEKEQSHSEEKTLEIMLFDNHLVTKRKAPWYDGKEESYVCFYRISETDMTVQTEKVFPCALSPTRSNAYFDEKNRRVFIMAGAAGIEWERPQISEWDFDTEKELSRYKINEGFFCAFPFQWQHRELESRIHLEKRYRKGKLEAPMPCSELSSEVLKWSKKPKEITVDFACMDNLILVRCQDHKVEKVYFSGDSVWERDFTDTYQKSEVFARKVYYVAVPADSLPYGHYQIVVQIGGTLYDSGKWFDVTIHG